MSRSKRPNKHKTYIDRDAELISRKLRSVLRMRRVRVPKNGYLLQVVRGKLKVEAL
jgi:hypothetical protein